MAERKFTPFEIKELNKITAKCGCPCHERNQWVTHIVPCCSLTYFSELQEGDDTVYSEEEWLDFIIANEVKDED